MKFTIYLTFSFITLIFIAPLQGYYSEALLTLARLKEQFKARVECVRVLLIIKRLVIMP